MPGPHDRIIAHAAKRALAPLGFRRKGRSRTWLADRGWWLAVVEFQPSAWSKGSYLNVAAHWLWSEMGFLSFDFSGRVHQHVEYLSDAQFAPAAAGLAELAAAEARRLTAMFTSLEATAAILVAEQKAAGEQAGGGWITYNAGVAAGLSGRADAAAEMFGWVLDSSAPEDSSLKLAAARMARLVPDPPRFKTEVAATITRHREALKLPPSDPIGRGPYQDAG